MARVEVVECNRVSGNDIRHQEDAPSNVGTCNHEECKDLEEQVIDDLDSYLEDVDDCLTISRMVSDSLIKGMVNAVTKEASEVVAVKEVEVARLKEVLYRNELGYSGFDSQFLTKKHGKQGNKPELEIRKEIEGQVFSTIIHGLCEEYNRRLFDVNNALVFIDRCKKISCIRCELDFIYKGLIGQEVGHLSPQGSLDVDNHHRKVLSNHGLHSGSLWDGNGELEEFKMGMPENFETSKLSHMSKQELYQYFRTEITKMKRDHESTIHKMTDENFALKRELLKERNILKEKGPFAMMKKDEDFETFKRKIFEVVKKLGDILKESEKLSEFCNYSRDSLDRLLTENLRLKDLLNSQKLEACYLSLQASDATKKLSQHLLVEENLQDLAGVLKSSLGDAHLEAVISEEVYGCILRDVSGKMESYNEDLDMKSLIMQDIMGTVYEEACRSADVAIESNDDEKVSNMESNLMQQIYGAVLQEVLRDMSVELNYMKSKCLMNDDSLVLLGSRASNLEKELDIEIENNSKLKFQCLELEKLIEDRDKSLYKVTEELYMTENLRKQQEALMADRNKELVLLREKLEDSHNHVHLYMVETDKLNEAIALYENKFRKSDEEKASLISAIKEQQDYLALVEAKDLEYKKQMKSLCYVIDGLSKSIADFEVKTNESIDWHCSRLENSASQLCSFVPKVNVLRRTSLLYKERLEKRCTDLQKAESEVDLLGDKVDALLSLLEKIYVALDHYSPVLQHYPGIIEILKLVKRELSGTALKVL